MKKLLVLALLFAASTTFAQQIKVSQKKAEFKKNEGNAYVGTAYQVNEKDAEKGVENFFKPYGGKVSSSRHQLFINNATVAEISTNPIDIYVLFVEKSETEIEVSIGYFNGTSFISSSIGGEVSDKAQALTSRLLLKLSQDGTASLLEKETKVLEKALKEAENLAQEKAKLEKQIEDYQEKIKDAKKDIEKNVSTSADQAKIIESQKIRVAEIGAKLSGLK